MRGHGRRRAELEEQLERLQARLLSADAVESELQSKDAVLRAKQEAEARREAEAQAAELRAREEAIEARMQQAMEAQYGSMKEELDAKEELLRSMKEELAAARAELRDCATEFEDERGALLQTIRAHDEEARGAQLEASWLRQVLVEHFAESRLLYVRQRSRWDEGAQQWRIPRALVAGLSNYPPHGAGGPPDSVAAAAAPPRKEPSDMLLAVSYDEVQPLEAPLRSPRPHSASRPLSAARPRRLAPLVRESGADASQHGGADVEAERIQAAMRGQPEASARCPRARSR